MECFETYYLNSFQIGHLYPASFKLSSGNKVSIHRIFKKRQTTSYISIYPVACNAVKTCEFYFRVASYSN